MNDPTSHLAARLDTIAGQPVLRFERRLPHSPATVWRALTEPAQMRAWFPALVDTELRVGAHMWFTFEGEDVSTHGEILELDEPKVYAFRWNDDVLRFEVLPQPEGCLLVFTHALGGGWAGRLGAGRNAAGWDVCLDGLQGHLAGERFPQPEDWLPRIEGYVERFGLATGEVEDRGDSAVVRFARDLVWMPVAQVWDLLVEGNDVERGGSPPLRFTNGYVPAGAVTCVDPPHRLEYPWLLEDEPAGRVHWELAHDPATGSRVVLTQTVPSRSADALPTFLAAWQVHLELLFAAVQGQSRPWPQGRTEQLEQAYRKRLGTVLNG
jgi:uncharacterized protein YndB with AHSA1/START domain